jgi:ABC-type Fe3+-hydroxamate transport system substrate-binding protein
LAAVKAGQVVCVDGNQHFNRPGPRLIDALEFLIGLLHEQPELIPANFPFERVSPA